MSSKGKPIKLLQFKFGKNFLVGKKFLPLEIANHTIAFCFKKSTFGISFALLHSREVGMNVKIDTQILNKTEFSGFSINTGQTPSNKNILEQGISFLDLLFIFLIGNFSEKETIEIKNSLKNNKENQSDICFIENNLIEDGSIDAENFKEELVQNLDLKIHQEIDKKNFNKDTDNNSKNSQIAYIPVLAVNQLPIENTSKDNLYTTEIQKYEPSIAKVNQGIEQIKEILSDSHHVVFNNKGDDLSHIEIPIKVNLANKRITNKRSVTKRINEQQTDFKRVSYVLHEATYSKEEINLNLNRNKPIMSKNILIDTKHLKKENFIDGSQKILDERNITEEICKEKQRTKQKFNHITKQGTKQIRRYEVNKIKVNKIIEEMARDVEKQRTKQNSTHRKDNNVIFNFDNKNLQNTHKIKSHETKKLENKSEKINIESQDKELNNNEKYSIDIADSKKDIFHNNEKENIQNNFIKTDKITHNIEFPKTIKYTHIQKETNHIIKSIHISQIGDTIKNFVLHTNKMGKHEAKIKLEPPHLGELDITLSIDNKEVKLLFTVEHPQAAQTLHQELHNLAKSLADLGLHLGGCEINYSGREGDQRHENFQFNFNQNIKDNTSESEGISNINKNNLIDLRV